ncbi:hypothetical protein [Nitrosomonas sp.]|uniref:hypothetical protein n=1 Tax=Nitrosomonas sp. TaxID=42353 RepID=UPI0025F3967C|nr:hypothetical protein [Nitrosomonas sp.]MBV6448531.1 hypothetical protein [Nitrosomonas sp.]
MRVGLIARGDNGGLGAQTWEFHRHVRPDVTLVVDLGDAGRGRCEPSRFCHGTVRVCGNPPSEHDLGWLLGCCDVVWTAEGAYNERLWALAADAGVATVLHANPELWRPGPVAPSVTLTPTLWMADRTGLPVLAVPVAADRFGDRRYVRGGWGRFYFPAAPAFHDRHGSKIVEEALPHIDRAATVYSRGPGPETWEAGRVTWRNLPPCENYWHAIPADIDVMILPRRYGGLSLPVQEALAQGIPVVMTDVEPNGAYTELRVPLLANPRMVRMKGGRFPVHDVDPAALARMLNSLNTAELKRASILALEWSEQHSWDRLLPCYIETLERAYQARPR